MGNKTSKSREMTTNGKPIVTNGATNIRYGSEYNMQHPNRGCAVIFNHEKFDSNTVRLRTGTKVDCENLSKTLQSLNFDVKVHNDLKLKQIHKELDRLSQLDHSNNDCILICIMSHGDLGYIHAKDALYKLDLILGSFTDQKCPSLAGKPRLFFIQACQGSELDDGVMLHRRIETDSESSQMSCEILNHPDFLIAQSSLPGYLSWRNTTSGAWFIQALCEELRENGKNEDLLTLLTFVSQRVALNFESNTTEPGMHEKKQIPCINSMLRRQIFFRDKDYF